MAAARPREAPPPPVIRKVGRYTAFITPPASPKPAETPGPQTASPRLGVSASPGKAAPLSDKVTPSPPPPKPSVAPRPQTTIRRPGITATPSKVAPLPEKATPSPPTPPVQVPPMQFEKPTAKPSGSVFGFFWDAVSKVQDAHSSLDEYLANWFGLNQSKYQWELNDYYEHTGKDKEGGKPKELASKEQAV